MNRQKIQKKQYVHANVQVKISILTEFVKC